MMFYCLAGPGVPLTVTEYDGTDCTGSVSSVSTDFDDKHIPVADNTFCEAINATLSYKGRYCNSNNEIVYTEYPNFDCESGTASGDRERASGACFSNTPTTSMKYSCDHTAVASLPPSTPPPEPPEPPAPPLPPSQYAIVQTGGQSTCDEENTNTFMPTTAGECSAAAASMGKGFANSTQGAAGAPRCGWSGSDVLFSDGGPVGSTWGTPWYAVCGPAGVAQEGTDQAEDDQADEGGETGGEEEEEEEDPCFPSDAIVTKADGTPSRIDALKEGDEILAATADGILTTDTVSFLSIAKTEIKAEYAALATAANKTLTLTPGHHVSVGASCCSTLRQAKDIEVGETVWAVKDGKATATTVTAKAAAVEATGLHSPVLTNGGFPIVDGVVTSFDSIDKVTLAKHGLAPLLKACKATGTCETFRDMFLSTEDRHYIA
jgi:hypothetical protein